MLSKCLDKENTKTACPQTAENVASLRYSALSAVGDAMRRETRQACLQNGGSKSYQRYLSKLTEQFYDKLKKGEKRRHKPFMTFR